MSLRVSNVLAFFGETNELLLVVVFANCGHVLPTFSNCRVNVHTLEVLRRIARDEAEGDVFAVREFHRDRLIVAGRQLHEQMFAPVEVPGVHVWLFDLVLCGNFQGSPG